MNDRQRLEAIVAVVGRYLPPDGISREEAMSQIIELVDPLPELAKPEQVITPISPDQYERFCGTCGACTGKPWVGLTEGELIDIQNCNRGFWVNAAKIEQLLKDKNI
jgi:hypothetical protein